MLQYYLKEKIINLESTASGIADLNGDGKVDVTDLMLIAQYISGEINKYLIPLFLIFFCGGGQL